MSSSHVLIPHASTYPTTKRTKEDLEDYVQVSVGPPISQGNYLYGTRGTQDGDYEPIRYLFKHGVKQSLLSDSCNNFKFGLYHAGPVTNVNEAHADRHSPRHDVYIRYSKDPYGYYPESRHTNSPDLPISEWMRNQERVAHLDISAMKAGWSVHSIPETPELKAVKSYTVDFNKLQPYKWTRNDEKTKLPPVAMDRFYKLTYHIPAVEETIEGKPPRSANNHGDQTDRSVHSVQSAQEIVDCTRCKLCIKYRDIAPCVNHVFQQKPETENSSKKIVKKKQIDKFGSKSTAYMKYFSPSANKRENNNNNNSTNNNKPSGLYNQVKQSINFFSSPHQRYTSSPAIERPLKAEKARYRPLTRVSVKVRTPTQIIPVRSSQSPVPISLTPFGEQREYKSADTYIRFIKSYKESMSGKSPPPMGIRGHHKRILHHSAIQREEITDNRLLESVMSYNKPSTSKSRAGRNTPEDGRTTATDLDIQAIPDWANLAAGETDVEDDVLEEDDGIVQDLEDETSREGSATRKETLTVDLPSMPDDSDEE